MTVYISGPMTRVDKLNFPLFNKVQQSLELVGFTVISPALVAINHGWASPDGVETGAYDESVAVELEHTHIKDCDFVIQLPDWIESKGCLREYACAVNQGKPIIDIEEFANIIGVA